MFKVRDARRWLEDGMKVKVTIRFRGREVTYPEIALEDLREIAEELRDISTVETAPSMEGRSMTLVLAPTKTSPKKPQKPAPESGKKEKAAQNKQPAGDKAAETKKAAEPAKETEKPKAAKDTKEQAKPKEEKKAKPTAETKKSEKPKTAKTTKTTKK
jgi:hypothetical protein